MLAVIHAVVGEKEKGAPCMTVWDVLHVFLDCTFVSGRHTKKRKGFFAAMVSFNRHGAGFAWVSTPLNAL